MYLQLALAPLLAAAVANAAEILSTSSNAQVVPNGYIVVLNDDVNAEAFDSHQAWVTNVHRRQLAKRGGALNGIQHTYNFTTGFKGYAGAFHEATINEIAARDDVKYIEPDTIVKASGIVTQSDAPWGLARVSSKKPGATDYFYDSSAGEGVTAYVVDTGIDISHPEFEGRATWGTNTADSNDVDCGNHGTHVSGTIAGKTYGIAKNANLVAVKVLGCDGSGSNSGVIKGMEWAVNDASRKGITRKSVMNMSLGGGKSQSSNDAAANVVSSGIFLAVAAGNDGQDARNSSPASEPSVCTVGASDSNDRIASFSNYGSIVDVFGPGVGILSSIPGGGTEQMSGTSMATPHVTGLGAYFIGLGKGSGGNICNYIVSAALNAVTGAPYSTTTKLINNGVNGNGYFHSLPYPQ